MKGLICYHHSVLFGNVVLVVSLPSLTSPLSVSPVGQYEELDRPKERDHLPDSERHVIAQRHVPGGLQDRVRSP